MLKEIAIILLIMLVFHVMMNGSWRSMNAFDPFNTFNTSNADAALGPSGTISQTLSSSDSKPAPVLGSAIYDENAEGVLPINHSAFETPAEFVSDVTNINSFYRSNPELFHGTGRINVPDASSWDEKARAMFTSVDNDVRKSVEAFNGLECSHADYTS